MASDEQIALEIVKEVVKARSGDVYDHAVKPWAKAVGELGKITLYPLQWVAERLREALERVPVEKRETPPKFIAGPILRALPNVDEEAELRALYVELLAKSMHVDERGNVHPAYRGLVDQLCPDEARLLEGLRPADPGAGIGLVEYTAKTIRSVDDDAPPPRRENARFGATLGPHLALDAPNNFGIYVENLLRLNIVFAPSGGLRGSQLFPPQDRVDASPEVAGWRARHPESERWRIQRSGLSEYPATAFGLGFLRAVLPAHPPPGLDTHVFRAR